MKFLSLVAALTLAACTTVKQTPADTTTVATPPLDSTVQHKIPPDTLVRGDGAVCVVRPTVKYANVELGQPYICNWRK